MNRTLRLDLLDGRRIRQIDGVVSLIAADASGQFGVLPGHRPLVTVLAPGLLRYRVAGAAPDDWRWAATVGDTLRCADGCIAIVSRRILGDDTSAPEALQTELDAVLHEEQTWRESARTSQGRIETALYQRLQQLAEQARLGP